MPIVPLPPGACDCHTHVIGPPDRFPMVASRHYTPGPASVDDLRAHLARHGLERVVIVQPSVYGTDNRLLVESLVRMDGAARGVAVIDTASSAGELAALDDAGVRGVRMNLESGGGSDAAETRVALVDLAERIAALGWHLQLFADLATIIALADRLAGLPVPVVLDHFAMVPAEMDPADRLARALVDLVASKNVHVKLSAPYRMPASSPAAADDGARQWAASLLAAAPDRMLWASDWPHTNREPGLAAHDVSRYRTLPPDALDRSIATWLPGLAARQRVLVDNPAALYRF